MPKITSYFKPKKHTKKKSSKKGAIPVVKPGDNDAVRQLIAEIKLKTKQFAKETNVLRSMKNVVQHIKDENAFIRNEINKEKNSISKNIGLIRQLKKEACDNDIEISNIKIDIYKKRIKIKYLMAEKAINLDELQSNKEQMWKQKDVVWKITDKISQLKRKIVRERSKSYHTAGRSCCAAGKILKKI